VSSIISKGGNDSLNHLDLSIYLYYNTFLNSCISNTLRQYNAIVQYVFYIIFKTHESLLGSL